MQIEVLDAVMIALLTVGFPVAAIWEHRRLQARVARGDANARTQSYRFTMLVQWPVSIVLFVLWLQAGRGLPELGLGTGVHAGTWIGWGLALATVAALVAQNRRVLRNPASLAAVRQQVEPVRDLVPSTAGEARLFTGLSITAGICEELVYRGYLIAILGTMFNTWIGVLLGSLVFGVGHAYQGTRGIAKSGVFGLAMAGLYLLSGSLWAPMLVHAAVDINSGHLGRRALADLEHETDVRAVA